MIDFLLENQSGDPFYLEVKSVTYVQNGVAKFPDAVTRRGLLHLKLLQEWILHWNKFLDNYAMGDILSVIRDLFTFL